MPVLSLCLIVRDEEQFLPECLESVKGIVDEIVVVDTGSTDRTVELALLAGARVFHHPWHDDFSAPRNEALARALGEWVLILDADERLIAGAGPALRAALNNADLDCGLLRLRHATRADDSWREHLKVKGPVEPQLLPRLLRRTADLQYRGAIHESAEESLVARGTRVSVIDADILHLGSLPDIRTRRSKRERNLRILRAQCAREPTDTTAYGYLAFELLENGDVAEAREVAERAWPLIEQQPKHRSVLRLAVARALGALRAAEPRVVMETVAAAEQREGRHADLFFLRGCALEMLALGAPSSSSDRDRLILESENAQRLALGRHGTIDLHQYIVGSDGSAASLRLGVLQLMSHRPQEALATFEPLCAGGAQRTEARLGRAEALLDLGNAAAAMASLEGVLDERPDGWLLIAAAAHSIGSTADARTFFARTLERADAGYLSPHRRERHQALALLLMDSPVEGALAALLARQPIARPIAIDDRALALAVHQFVERGEVHNLVPLLEPRAEAACPGVGPRVRALLGASGFDVEDTQGPRPVFVGSFDAADLEVLKAGLLAHSHLNRGARTVEWVAASVLVTLQAIAERTPQAKFIQLIRDGRAVSSRSVLPVAIAVEWAAVTESVRQQGASLPGRYLEVRYEDLLQDPVSQLDRVFAFVGEGYEPAAGRALNASYPGRADAWRDTLSADVIAAVERTARSGLVAAGYGARR